MKKLFLTLFVIINFYFSVFSQVFTETFDDRDFQTNPTWIGNNNAAWRITDSKIQTTATTNTLKLNASTRGTYYLSTPNTGVWGEEQTWTFWVGRENQEGSTDNRSYIWLWADRPDLNNPLINGYRIRIGDNTQGGDNVVLERIKEGGSIINVVDNNHVIPQNVSTYGLLVQVTRNKNSGWTIFSSVSPAQNGGVHANTPPVSQNALFNRNLSVTPVVEKTFTNFSNGYFGLMAYTNTSSASSWTAAEFDQFNFSPSIAYDNYTWVGAVNTDYHNAGNWNPNRITPRATDVLNFNTTSTVLMTSSDFVSGLIFHAGSDILFNNSGNATAISILGSAALGLDVKESASFYVSTFHDFHIELLGGARGEIRGEVVFDASSSGTDHKLRSRDSLAITVYGKIRQNVKDYLFGRESTSTNNVVFKAGSEFISEDGGSAFGPSAVTKARFEKGSYYRHKSGIDFSGAGRTYGIFELNNFGSTINISTSNTRPMRVDHLILTRGSIETSNTTGLVDIVVNGNLNISNISSINLQSTGAGKSRILLSGASSSIQASNRITLNKNSTLQFSNNYMLAEPLTINGIGTLFLQAGTLNLNAQALSFSGRATIKKTDGKLSAPIQTNNNLRFQYGDGVFNQVITTGTELLPTAAALIIENPKGLILNKALFITDSIFFNTGILFTNGTNLPLLGANGKAVNYSNLSHVDGPIAKETNSTEEFIFPVGDEGALRTASIIPSTVASSIFRGTYINLEPPYFTEFGEGIKGVSHVEYWDIRRTTGATNGKIKLTWNANSSLSITDPEDFRVAFLNVNLWIDKGLDNIPTNAQEGFIISKEISFVNSTNAPLPSQLYTLGSANGAVVFPVTYLSFIGEANVSTSRLKWATSVEINNKGFVIEKSLDAVNFSEIGFVEGVNTPNSTYEFEDVNFKSSAYYRLKQLDFNGDYENSTIIYISQQFKLIVKPNPFKEDVQIINSNPFEEVLVSLRNMQGVEIWRFRGAIEAINKILSNQFDNRPTGLYYLMITKDKSPEVIKIFKE